MRKNKVYNLNDCKNIASSRVGACLSIQYNNSSTKMLWKCKNDHIWLATLKNINTGQWCRKCFNLSQKLTIEECQITALSKNGKCLSTKYIGNNKKMLWECEFGHQWRGKYEHIKNGHWCPKCVGRFKYTLNDCIKAAQKNNGFCLTQEYTTLHSKMQWQCSNNHIWWATFGAIVKDAWCSLCYKNTINDCVEYAKIYDGQCLSIIYNNNKEKLLWQCYKGHQWQRSFTDTVTKKTWCLICKKKVK